MFSNPLVIVIMHLRACIRKCSRISQKWSTLLDNLTGIYTVVNALDESEGGTRMHPMDCLGFQWLILQISFSPVSACCKCEPLVPQVLHSL